MWTSDAEERHAYLLLLADAARGEMPPSGVDTSLEKALSVIAGELLAIRVELDEVIANA